MHPVWDIPTRAFHWLLVIAVFLSWLSSELDWIDVHLWSGYTALTLVVFRLGWGVVGSLHSRFSDFLRGPKTILSYLRGEEPRRPGHNPLGGLSILALLTLVLAQAVTGLFNSDGLLFDGPLYYALDTPWSDRMGAWHETLFWVLVGFVALHLVAVLFYQFGKRQNLIGPMITGGENGAAAPAGLLRALLVVAISAGLLALAVYFAPEPDLPW